MICNKQTWYDCSNNNALWHALARENFPWLFLHDSHDNQTLRQCTACYCWQVWQPQGCEVSWKVLFGEAYEMGSDGMMTMLTCSLLPSSLPPLSIPFSSIPSFHSLLLPSASFSSVLFSLLTLLHAVPTTARYVHRLLSSNKPFEEQERTLKKFQLHVSAMFSSSLGN